MDQTDVADVALKIRAVQKPVVKINDNNGISEFLYVADYVADSVRLFVDQNFIHRKKVSLCRVKFNESFIMTKFKKVS